MASKIEKSDKILKEDATKITEQEKDPNNKDQKDSKMDLQTLNTCIDPPHEQKKESRGSCCIILKFNFRFSELQSLHCFFSLIKLVFCQV